MQKHTNIKALFFLGVFSLLLLHNIAPHTHHQHKAEHSHKAVAHYDGHSHHHGILENENAQKGFLGLFLEVHEHSVSFNETVVTHESSVKQLNVKNDVKTSIFLNRYSISINYDDEEEKITGYHTPNNYFNSYLSSLDSRGPPSLG